MNLQHFNVKVFVDETASVDLERLIEVFHGWIAAQSLPELLIDVADYRHVPSGPAVVLIGHEADYAIDLSSGRVGLVYNRKSLSPGSIQDRLREAFRSALVACDQLERQLDGLKFGRSEFEVTINDRALAPNTAATFELVQPQVEQFLKGELGQSDCRIDYVEGDQRRLFRISVGLVQPIDVAQLSPATA